MKNGGNKMKVHKSKNLLTSFKYAFQGILPAFKQERNLKIHTCFVLLVIIAGIWLKISYIEWLICILLFGVVLAAELINTAIETTVDLVTQEIQPLAKQAKDIAAAAVLVLAITSSIIGLMIFLPKLIK